MGHLPNLHNLVLSLPAFPPDFPDLIRTLSAPLSSALNAHVSIIQMPTPRIRTVEGSCWGCNERRVICDLTLPACAKCSCDLPKRQRTSVITIEDRGPKQCA